ncbi:ribosomal L28e protein family-domain-containing protein [Leucosporidium creatinivorum]|uniref:Ribosomal L28e protein family-domain-containing protein n=1 Tax=Leucosporidium creatinivorum TaxID=106004 RepID=A0A1Y2FPV9_9BASI|nr:ribosomal L28e protein family-domain-containing protein [Leucosporidium creatinivorum]
MAQGRAGEVRRVREASGNIASPDLLWLLTKKGTSFTHKRVGAPVFSAEKGNLRNLNSFKFSGLANARTLDISAKASGNGVVLTERDPKASPFANASAFKSKGIKGKGGRKVAGAVARQSGSAAGRLDLLTAAQARASAILASQSARKEQRQRALRGNKIEA